ncbi:Global transcription regulator sge1 [Fusarium solani]
MSPLDQIHHRHPIPLDSGACPVTKPAETEETAFRINAKQTHRILKRRAARQKFEEKFGLNRKSRRPYLHESLHNHAMRLPRGPGGRFLSRAEVAAMANGTDGKGGEGCVNDARGPESAGSDTSTTICALAATFQGYINTTFDALIVFEACMSGKLIPIFRRPESRELSELIQSGNVFVYKVEESGIKRLRDGVSWSPGRVLEDFLVYRELEQPSMPGVKKRDFKKPKKICNDATSKLQLHLDVSGDDWSLIGSLVDSYHFKKNGLVKKTIGITYQSVTYRLVSYYKCEDVKQGRLLNPSEHPELGRISPRDELLTLEFSASINTTGMNSTLDHFHRPPPMTYDYYSPIVQQGEISMGYFTEITGLYHEYQHPLLSYLQPQYEEQQEQHAMFYSLPYC